MPTDPFATRLVQDHSRPIEGAPLTAPIYNTTAFVFDDAEDVRKYQEGRSRKFIYSRYENPTVVEVEERLAALDGAERGLLFSSGTAAAVTVLLSLLKAGDEVVCSAAVYGGTIRILRDVLAPFGVGTRFVALGELREAAQGTGSRTRLVWFESPVNPTLRCVDVGAVAAACRAAGVWSVFDNTFATPINQQPLALGVDLVVQSVTKYLNGHSDVTGGVVTGRRELLDRIALTRRHVGSVLDPMPASALGRGLKTLHVRMERHAANALALARALEQGGQVARVLYPGLPSHPDHALASRQMRGFSGMLTLDVGDEGRAVGVFDRLRLIKRAASLGGVESIVSLPILTSHWGHSPAQLAEAGITPGMVRISVGLEDAGDLIADVTQALG